MSKTFVEPDAVINGSPSPLAWTSIRKQLPFLPIPSGSIRDPKPSPNIGPKIQVLHLEGIDRQLFWYLHRFIHTPLVTTSFHHLQELRLELDTTGGGRWMRSTESLALQGILRTAESLVKLLVSWLVPNWYLSLAQVFPADYTWQGLAFLELNGIAFNAEELASLLQRHQSSLRRLTIRAGSVERVSESEELKVNLAPVLLQVPDIPEFELSATLGQSFASATRRLRLEDDERVFTAIWT